MKRKIAVYVRNRTALARLQTFFDERDAYLPFYCSDGNGLAEIVRTERPMAVIAEDSTLDKGTLPRGKTPLVVCITGSLERGIDTALHHNARCYFQKTFSDKDLEAKISIIGRSLDRIEALSAEVEHLRILTSMIEHLSATLNPQEVLFRILRSIAEQIHVTRCSMIRIDSRKKFAYVIASFESSTFSPIRLSLKKYPEILHALEHRKPVLITDVGNDPIMKQVREILKPLGIKSILVIPVIFKDSVIGTLFLRTSRKGPRFTATEIGMLTTIARISSNALNNAFLFEQLEDEKTRLEKLAITDYLTGIYNIRYFYHRITEEFSRAERYSFNLSCLMMDIDFFEKINDTHGHKTGDSVLKQFAQLLKRHSRKSDVLARYGGEEFIIMLPQTDISGALSEAERLRNAVKKHQFKGLKKGERITMSVGIALMPNPKIKSYTDLISAADDALYAAKTGGRDRAVVFEA